MSDTPLKKRRATILVTGPQSKRTIYNEDETDDKNSVNKRQNQNTLQDVSVRINISFSYS